MGQQGRVGFNACSGLRVVFYVARTPRVAPGDFVQGDGAAVGRVVRPLVRRIWLSYVHLCAWLVWLCGYGMGWLGVSGKQRGGRVVFAVVLIRPWQRGFGMQYVVARWQYCSVDVVCVVGGAAALADGGGSGVAIVD